MVKEGRYTGTGKAERLLNGALDRVESKTVRQWVVEGRNANVWLQIAENAVTKAKKDPANADDVLYFSSYIVAVWLDGPSGK